MAKTLYTAEAHVTGGRDKGRGRTTDGALEVDLRIPKDLGGDGGGTNPEQLFAIGFASCFESALQAAARRARLETGDAEVDSKVMLSSNDAKGFDLSVELDITLPSIDDPAQAKELVEAAHKICPYSNATRGNIDVKLVVNGQDV
jgi:lipoyl-dependent peroxiredoxin